MVPSCWESTQSTTKRARDLVDRAAECERLDGLVADARSGTSAAVVVRGEPGVGKSALLDHVAANANGCRVMRAAGVESEMELPFATLHQLCAPLLAGLGRLPAPQSNALGTAFGITNGPPPDRFLVGVAVLSLLTDAAESQPLLCLVDDAQWLDRESAQVLGFVARRVAAESVVIIFAVRLSIEIPELAGVQELMAGPLADADARALLESVMSGKLDESVRERILAEASGNPLALMELARAWKPLALAGGFGLPDSASVTAKVEELFRRQLRPLREESRHLLLVAAAEPVGDPAPILAAAARLGIPVDAADAAMASGLIDMRTQVRFRHPLVRSVVYQEASVGQRRAVHRALAEATDPETDPDRRAWHLAAAASGPDEDIAAQLERSATRAQARGGLAANAAFLELAVRLTDDPARRGERALAAAQASFLAGAFEAVQQLLETAEAGPLDGFQRARIDLLRGHVALASGLFGDAPSMLLLAAQRLEPFDRDLASQTYLEAWGAASVATEDLEARGVLLEISRAIRALPRRSEASHPLDLLLDGLALLSTESRAAATPALQRAAKALADIPVQDVLHWGWMATAPSNAVWDQDGVLAISARQVRLLRDVGALAQLPLHLSALGLATAWIGDFPGAGALIAEADSVAAAIGSPTVPWTTLRLRALQGREAEASLAIEQAAAGGHTFAAYAHWAAAVLYNGLARYEEAASAARRATSNTFEYWVSVWALPELIEAAARVRDIGLAREALDRLAETTRPAGTDFGLGIEARSRALLSDNGTAEQLYREAIDRLSRTAIRPELARAHLIYGEWLRSKGRRVEARDQLRTAHDLFLAIGMEAFGERARHELLATGERVRTRSLETQDQLTPQELQIARLASDGRTNPEIGAQLFLSRRTVEWHLRKVYDKLDVRSRRELPVALRRTTRVAPRI